MTDRQKIVNTAADLYLKFGIKSIRIDDLADELGISKKTIYEHFRSKEDLIESVLDEIRRFIHRGIEKEIDSHDDIFDSMLGACIFFVTIIDKLTSSFVYTLKKYQYSSYCDLKDFSDKELYSRFEKLVNSGIRKCYFRNDLSFNTLFEINMARISGIFNSSSDFQNIQYTKEIFFLMLVNSIRGITTIEGHKILDEKVKKFLEDNKQLNINI
ncbi:MAG TPA: TetR/AcrR family transcriptional regulator [Methanofastidiosum sp.]|nr:TetR/AcrR family transcriptional regulator [Methanofastidiosum sp.]